MIFFFLYFLSNIKYHNSVFIITVILTLFRESCEATGNTPHDSMYVFLQIVFFFSIISHYVIMINIVI